MILNLGVHAGIAGGEFSDLLLSEIGIVAKKLEHETEFVQTALVERLQIYHGQLIGCRTAYPVSRVPIDHAKGKAKSRPFP